MSQDVVGDLIARMSGSLGIPVYGHRPHDAPDECITVSREGGARENRLLDHPGIGIYCWSIDEPSTSRLANRIADFMERLQFKDGYCSARMISMRSDPDPDARIPRWYLSYQLTTYGKE